jgi:hypothetical protein
MSRALILLIACLALVGAGCGDSDTSENGKKLSGALGGEGEQDAKHLKTYLTAVHDVPNADIDVVKAFTSADLDAGRKAVDRMREIGTNSKTIAQDFQGSRLREFFVSYSGRIVALAGAYQRVIDGPQGVSEKELIKGVQQAKVKLQRQDQKFLDTLKDTVSHEQYEQIQGQIRDLNDRYNDAAGG